MLIIKVWPFTAVKSSYRRFHVDLGECVGNNDKIWTLAMNTENPNTPIVLLHVRTPQQGIEHQLINSRFRDTSALSPSGCWTSMSCRRTIRCTPSICSALARARDPTSQTIRTKLKSSMWGSLSDGANPWTFRKWFCSVTVSAASSPAATRFDIPIESST